MHERQLVIICGPTASGKSGLYEQLWQQSKQNLECINADTGQMYKELSIGTAKPNFTKIANSKDYHLFDTINLGQCFSACRFRKRVEELCLEIWNRGNQPVIVGGSMFYISSLFFPPSEPISLQKDKASLEELKNSRNLWSNEQLYDALTEIDPERAGKIMPNDRYRLTRALDIFDEFGIRPSQIKPEFSPLCQKIRLIFLCPERIELDQKIRARLKIMLKPRSFSEESGWIEETSELIKDPAKLNFISRNRLIGYSQIANWILSGKESRALDALEDEIFFATRDYSRKQIKFWKNLERRLNLTSPSDFLRIISIKNQIDDPGNLLVNSIFEKN